MGLNTCQISVKTGVLGCCGAKVLSIYRALDLLRAKAHVREYCEQGLAGDNIVQKQVC